MTDKRPPASDYDVVIIGAGPAGCACALGLGKAQLKVALLDKSVFPRDKICGDAIPLRAFKTLKNIDPQLAAKAQELPAMFHSRHMSLNYQGKKLSFDWVADAYNCSRLEFDHFLFAQVSERTDTQIFAPSTATGIVATPECVSVATDSGQVFRAKMVIGADGANGLTARQLADQKLDRDHHVGSVRAYYSNVPGCDNHTQEVYFDKRYLPSYFWVFPLPGNMANVGFGMLSSHIARKKVNLKKAFYEFIDQTPEVKNRLAGAVQVSPLEGFGLPLGSRKTIISGERYLLAGDAASLIDPLTGDGIGNAMLSGRLAARQVQHCFDHGDFSAGAMHQYQIAVNKALGQELRSRYAIQRTLTAMPFLLESTFLLCRHKGLKKWIQKFL